MNNLTVNLTLLLLIFFLELNFCEEVVKEVQGFPTCSCPLDELNASLGLQVSLLFLMCPTAIAGRCHERLSSAFLMENWYLTHDACAYKAKKLCCHAIVLYLLYLLQGFLETQSIFSSVLLSTDRDTLEDIKQQKSKEDMVYIILFIRTLLTGK